MACRSLSDFIKTLENRGELLRITCKVSPCFEITEITDRISKSDGMALLFMNNGSEFPVLINAFGSEKRICLALGRQNLDELSEEISSLLKFAGPSGGSLLQRVGMLPKLLQISRWFPVIVRGKGKCQEVIMNPPDLGRLPVLTCWPHDGGPFITLPLVHTRDLNTGSRNVGMYRMQVLGPSSTAMHWQLHKNSARHYREYKSAGRQMPVAVTLGGDPACTYAATAPLPDHVDEYILAGFLRKKPVRLVKCLTIPLEVPDDADFVIEGYIDTAEELTPEGPFGDHTGFYSLTDLYPVFHVTCITHRRDAVYPATVVGIPPMEDAWLGLATEKIFSGPIRLALQPEILGLHMPSSGVFHNLMIISIQTHYEGQAAKTMNGLWGAGQMMFTKFMIALPADIAVTDYRAAAERCGLCTDLAKHLLTTRGPADVLDHASREFAYGGKAGIDATGPPVRKPDQYRIDSSTISKRLPAITAINDHWAARGILFCILAIDKRIHGNLREVAGILRKENLIEGIPFVVFTDHFTDVFNIHMITWYVLNNTDPGTDLYIMEDTCFIDGTIKAGMPGFMRPWPNPVVSSPETVALVNENWETYGIGHFIPSPSEMYRGLCKGNSAVRGEY